MITESILFILAILSFAFFYIKAAMNLPAVDAVMLHNCYRYLVYSILVPTMFLLLAFIIRDLEVAP